MAELPQRKRMSTDEFLALSPNERHKFVRDGIITDWEQVPQHVRDRIQATAKRLADEGYGP